MTFNVGSNNMARSVVPLLSAVLYCVASWHGGLAKTKVAPAFLLSATISSKMVLSEMLPIIVLQFGYSLRWALPRQSLYSFATATLMPVAFSTRLVPIPIFANKEVATICFSKVKVLSVVSKSSSVARQFFNIWSSVLWESASWPLRAISLLNAMERVGISPAEKANSTAAQILDNSSFWKSRIWRAPKRGYFSLTMSFFVLFWSLARRAEVFFIPFCPLMDLMSWPIKYSVNNKKAASIWTFRSCFIYSSSVKGEAFKTVILAFRRFDTWFNSASKSASLAIGSVGKVVKLSLAHRVINEANSVSDK